MSLFSDINTWDVGKTLEKVKNFYSCSPNIPRVHIREQRHGKRVLMLKYTLYTTIFSYHGNHFHSMEFDKTIEIGFSNVSNLQ